MATHVYFTRIEHLNGYVNARPLYEVFGDGLEEVEREFIGPHGTVTITGGASQDGLEDGRYCIFTITDEDFRNLEQTNNGYRIKTKEFTSKSKTVDAFPIREVIKIPSIYSVENYNAWSKEVFSNIEPPITKNVFLFNNGKVYGPFKYQSIDSQGYIFTPNSLPTETTDGNFVKCFDSELLQKDKTLLGIPDYQSERFVFGEYDRYVLYLKTLPEHFTEIDCISDDVLKSVVGNVLSAEGKTKSERNEIKASINALPTEKLSEGRRERVLKLVENGELADMAIRLIPTVLASDDTTLQSILGKVFSNRDYISKLYPIIREQEGFADALARLEEEKLEKEHELENIDAEIEKKQQSSDTGITTVSCEEIERLQEIIQQNKTVIEQQGEEIEQYRHREKLNCEVSDLKSQIEDLRSSRRSVEREIDEYQNTLKKKTQESYSSLAFDGIIASMMIEEAAKFEKRREEERIKKRIKDTRGLAVNDEVDTPAQLIDFLWDKLNNVGHRSLEKNDVANIMLCISQGFITIFAGEPGVGKTSMVDMLATFMGLNNPDANRYTEIAVEKGWTSRRDLIGYYNPLTKVFDSANRGIFDALTVLDREKKEDIKEFPYWILLDEANLSQMEYYWADFMGICDLNKQTRRISLGEDYQFDVADTLRFLATINLDHTTESLSARLIDRSWIIELDSIDLDFDEYLDSDLDYSYPLVKYSVLQQLYDAGRNPSGKMDDILEERFDSIKEIFQGIGIRFSPRIIGMIKKYCIASTLVMNRDESENNNSFAALDYAVAQKILPMINGYGDDYNKFIETLLEECDETTMPKSNSLLKKILRSGRRNMQNYQFFGR